MDDTGRKTFANLSSCFLVMGRANEQIAGIQENYSAQATSYWLESLERNLAMMKEYQVSCLKAPSIPAT